MMGSSASANILKNTYTRRQLMVPICFAYGNFWVAACVSLQAPFFPAEAERKGASPTIYGAIFAVYELMIIIMSPIFGKMISVVSPNFLVETGLFSCGFSTVLFGILHKVPYGTPFISLAFAIRTFEGVAAAAFLNASYTIMAGEFPERVATIFALLETCFGLGLILGPTVGGALFEWGGYPLPFVVLGTFLLLGGVLTFCFLPTSGDIPTEKSGSIWVFMCDWSTILDALSTATCLNFIGFNAATLEPHLRQFGLKPTVTGALFMLTGAVYALMNPFMGKLCEAGFNEKMLSLMGCILVFIGVSFLGPLSFLNINPAVWLIIVSLLTIGLGSSAKLVSSYVGTLKHTIKVRGYPDDRSTYGLVSALFFSSCSVGAFIGPSAGGYFLENFGYRKSTLYLIIVEGLLIIMLSAYKIREKFCPPNHYKRIMLYDAPEIRRLSLSHRTAV